VDTTTTTLPVDPADPAVAGQPPTRRARWPWVVVAIPVLFGVLSLIALVVELPYYAISPGSARPTEPTIQVSGTETFPGDDDILFTTVSLSRGRINGWEWLQAQLDDSIDLVDADVIEGGHTVEENQQINQQLMDDSQDVAIVVALEHLGYDVIDGTGATVGDVLPESPAAEELGPGDDIVRAGGEPIERKEDLVRQIEARQPGDELDLVVEPADGGRERVSVTLGAFSNSQEQPCVVPGEEAEGVTVSDQTCIGVSGLTTRDEERNFPFDVSIDPGRVRGPSAGLAFTLATLDVLTPGDITGGQPVAVTGTIDSLGNVGPIGGAEYKAIAARAAGAEVFLVPRGEEDIAASKVGDDVRIIPISTLDEALDALEDLGGEPVPTEVTSAP
jgi:PDZ domain-containing protein